MKSVGDIIKTARTRKKISKEKLADKTRIKREFIDAIEKGNWESLPEYPVVVGFVKVIASGLDIEERSLVAVLRRDYRQNKIPSVNPKPDLPQKFSWGPKSTFLLGVLVVTILVVGYLITQYVSFISPPPLTVTVPEENLVVAKNKLTVSGNTDPDVVVLVNNQLVLVDENGNFQTEIEVFKGTEEIKIVAKSRSGKETVISRKIKVDFK